MCCSTVLRANDFCRRGCGFAGFQTMDPVAVLVADQKSQFTLGQIHVFPAAADVVVVIAPDHCEICSTLTDLRSGSIT